MRISKNFTFEEFTASDTAKAEGIINQVTDFDTRDNIISLVKEVLQPLRDAVGKPLHINSGYRSAELNKRVGGVPTSQHCKGEAADVSGASAYTLAKTAVELGLTFDQCILYPTFCHFSFKRNGENRNQILYNKKYKGKRL